MKWNEYQPAGVRQRRLASVRFVLVDGRSISPLLSEPLALDVVVEFVVEVFLSPPPTLHSSMPGEMPVLPLPTAGNRCQNKKNYH